MSRSAVIDKQKGRLNLAVTPKMSQSVEYLMEKWECATASETIRRALFRTMAEEKLLEEKGGAICHKSTEGDITVFRGA